MQRAMRIAALDSLHGFENILEPFQGRHPTQFIDKVLLRSRHDKPFADRTAALRGYSSHGNRSGELHSHHAPVKALIVEKQSVFSRILAPTGKPPANFGMRVSFVYEGEDLLHRCRKWIGEKEKGRIFDSRFRPPGHADLVL
jgi:hypothetical protein